MTWTTASNGKRDTKARLLLDAVELTGQSWADIGCGDGIFTRLLAERLPAGSTVHAVDKNRRALDTLHRARRDWPSAVAVETHHADFRKTLNLPELDGLLLANSLHFVRRKQPVLARLVELLVPGGQVVLVEYNAARGNGAVPHPLDDAGFLSLAEAVGLCEARIAQRVPSSFLGEMYLGVGRKSVVQIEKTT